MISLKLSLPLRVNKMAEKKCNKSKVEQEKKIVADMIALYCRKVHRSRELCPVCKALAEYAMRRSDLCPQKEDKTFCSQCTTHCYSPQMREQIRRVMRFSGPRMLFYHPIAALRHLYYSKIKS